MVKIKYNHKSIWFLYGMLLGAVCFLLIYGVKVLDFTNDSWIMLAKDQDIKQHYLGWCHYRKAPWSFPFGLTKSLSNPYYMSIIYTDSIPLFAVFFKLFSWALPDTFQYMGLFGIISFALTGGISAALIRRLTDKKILAAIAPIVFIISPVMLFRMFYHTSLSSQWIVLCCIYYMLDGFYNRSMYEQRKICLYAGALCVGIHIYFLPIVAGFIFMSAVEKMLDEQTILNPLWMMIKNLFCFGLSAFCAMFALGAFIEKTGNENYAVGDFGANLNTFINPLGMSKYIGDMPLYNDFQVEGSAYLGLGMLALLVVSIGILIFNLGKNKGHISIKALSKYPMITAIVLLCICFATFAISPVFTIGAKKLIIFSYPKKIQIILGIFRSNGRFIWPVFYFIYIGIFKIISGMKRYAVCVVVIILGIVLQFADLSDYIKQTHERMVVSSEEYSNLWDLRVGDKLDGYKHFVLFSDSIIIYQNVGYYAYENGMDMNRFYFARDIDKQIEEQLDEHRRELENGVMRDNTVYVMTEDDYKLYKDCGLYFYPLKYMVFGTNKRIDGLKEVSSDDLIQMGWK